ncbi:MAG: alpha-amylase family glycosyl hydrolase [Anaerolineae bacterium]|nr:alpha-amylase family glycosyl hydrolase [Anaerolineae bacterium]
MALPDASRTTLAVDWATRYLLPVVDRSAMVGRGRCSTAELRRRQTATLGGCGRVGQERWQGAPSRGQPKLSYLKALGVTTIWLSRCSSRGHLNTYHGYGVQDFSKSIPLRRRSDLVDLVAEAHRLGIRIILDIIFNHPARTGCTQETPEGVPAHHRRYRRRLGREGAASSIRG